MLDRLCEDSVIVRIDEDRSEVHRVEFMEDRAITLDILGSLCSTKFSDDFLDEVEGSHSGCFVISRVQMAHQSLKFSSELKFPIPRASRTYLKSTSVSASGLGTPTGNRITFVLEIGNFKRQAGNLIPRFRNGYRW